ncbi:MAG: tRNA pseudouridine(38-40) synthase TruA [Nonlabens sp.]
MLDRQRYFIELAYDGSQYHGWQRQPNAITVQQVVEESLSKITRTAVTITGAGRTDTGVHARQMFAHFDIASNPLPENLVYKMNRLLPRNISIFRIFAVHDKAHTRFDAIARSYEYHFHLRPDPFYNKSSYILHRIPDFILMQKAALKLLGSMDFKCFSRSQTQVKTYICDVSEARFEVSDLHVIFHITANRFLRNMVRAVVGTLLQVGYGTIAIDDIDRIIASRDRNQAGSSAAAQGLYLSRIVYPVGLVS